VAKPVAKMCTLIPADQGQGEYREKLVERRDLHAHHGIPEKLEIKKQGEHAFSATVVKGTGEHTKANS